MTEPSTLSLIPINPISVTLAGAHVRLVPPDLQYVDDLVEAAKPDEIWEYIVTAPGQSREEMQAWMNEAINETQTGARIWFIIVRKSDDCAIGATSYMDIHHKDRGLEIGGTWISISAWRTPINTECKYLLLRHAFEALGCLRVQLKTDARNIRSQKAIERIGAVKEGVLRKHMLTRAGYLRDTVMYSIIDTEWQAVKARLEEKLSQP